MGSKIIYVLGGMILLNLAMIVFSCSSWDTTTGECTGSAISGDNSSVIGFASNPTAVGGSAFWEILFGSGWGLLAAVGLVSAIVIGAVFFKGQEVVWIAMAIGITTTVYPAIRLWALVSELSVIGDTLARTVLAVAVVSIMIITVLFTIIDWARGRE